MNSALKRELFWLSGIVSLAALTLGQKRLAGIAGMASVGLMAASTKDDYSLRGQSIYITGGSRGLGLSLAWNTLEQGAKAVTLVARSEEELSSARELLLRDFPNAQVELCACDVTDAEELSSSIDAAIEAMGQIDLLINDAGTMLVAPIGTLERKEFEAQMNLHLYAVVESTKLITPHFKARGGGRILNICSLGGKAAVPHMLPYTASKFALSGFAQGASAELAADNIIMTTAYPTVMRTGSPKQAVFKGDHEKEFLWFAGLDNLPGLSLSADQAAKDILAAVIEGRSEVILSVTGKARVLAGALIPETINAVMGFAARLLPKGQSTQRLTGRDSARIFDKNPLLAPLKKRSDESEVKYNQLAGHDPDHNLGLKH